MTLKIGSAATDKVVARMSGPAGIGSSLAALSMGAPGQEIAAMRAQNVAAELAERSGPVRYPVVHVYCDKMVNDLREKFRRFSGKVQMTIELRHSQDRLEGMQDVLDTLVDATASVLDAAIGDWGDGMFYGGGYEVAYGVAKHGGKNFIQVAKVTFEIRVSRS